MKQKEDVRVLLVQVREEIIKKHEFGVVVETSGLSAHQFDVHDVLTEEQFNLARLKEYDAVMIGGSGAYSVTDDESFIDFLEDIVRYCKTESIPYLGLCFGMQVAVQALGGKVITDVTTTEAGTFTMYRNEASDTDPVVGSLPREFLAGCGRKDLAVELPEGMVNYISSDRCPNHFVTYPGTTFYGVQFHPELWKRSDNIVRLDHFKGLYNISDKEYESVLERFTDAPESRLIISNFIDKVVLK